MGGSMKNRPRTYDISSLENLRSVVQDHQFIRIDDPNQLPAEITNPAGEKYRSTILASSGYEPEKGKDVGDYEPSGTVILIRLIRYCEHDGNPHFNVDSRVLWSDSAGRAWQASYTGDPDHYEAVITGTDLPAAGATYRLPKSPRGTLDEFTKTGGYLDFKGPCPGL
jgi:hypothetical protein